MRTAFATLIGILILIFIFCIVILVMVCAMPNSDEMFFCGPFQPIVSQFVG